MLIGAVSTQRQLHQVRDDRLWTRPYHIVVMKEEEVVEAAGGKVEMAVVAIHHVCRSTLMISFAALPRTAVEVATKAASVAPLVCGTFHPNFHYRVPLSY